MDTDNGSHHYANGHRVDLGSLGTEPQMQDDWVAGRNLLLELDDPTFGAPPAADCGADAASDEDMRAAPDAASTIDGKDQKDGPCSNIGNNGLATGSFRCPLCRVDILYLTERQCQSHMDYGRHMYPEYDPAEDYISSLTRYHERAMDFMKNYWQLVRHYGHPQSILQEQSALKNAMTTESALYYTRIRTIFNQRLGAVAGPAPMLAALRAHDKWVWQYCVYVLGRPPMCEPLAPQYENELRQNGAVIVDLVPRRLRLIMMPPHYPFSLVLLD